MLVKLFLDHILFESIKFHTKFINKKLLGQLKVVSISGTINNLAIIQIYYKESLLHKTRNK
jgi:hypothetical protein